jgi:glycosyltransferase involved in cell wall biosynthesis
MSRLPLVSVVIPCLNREAFLRPTIESVLGQDYPEIECLVVDGGSTDGTLEILRGYGERIRWVSEPDQGHADAINKGWRMSQGEVLAWLNADDVWAVPGAARRAVEYLEAHPETDVVYGDCGAIDADGRLVGMSYMHPWSLEHAVEHCDHCIPQPAAFVRRRAAERVGWLNTAFYQKKDHEFWLRVGLTGRIDHLPVLLAHARATRGLSFDGRTAAPACLQVTRAFYTLPGVPEALRRKRRRALSNSYLRGMDYAADGGPLWGIIFRYALAAILMDPRNGPVALRRLRDLLEARGGRGPGLRAARAVLDGMAWGVRRLKGGSGRPRIPNLLGDRDIEWAWIAATTPEGPGEALDFGAGESPLGLLAVLRGFRVTTVDLREIWRPYRMPGLCSLRGDVLTLPLAEAGFDLVISCSTVEHVGLVGRYGVVEASSDGDLEAMARLRLLLKPGGRMLLTVPVGRDAVFPPLTRVYGETRLPHLLRGYDVEREAYWIKDAENRWTPCDRGTALTFEASAGSWDPLQNAYALAGFVLRRP